ncbi:HEAT repeat domain-containing protein [bacterium]|nr:HEAT repeat domain-containing protein [bacterium]
MDRRTKILSAGVIAGFALLAMLPFIGVNPVSLTARLSSLWSHDSAGEVHNIDAHFSLASLESGDPELVKAAIYALSNSLKDEEVSMLFPFVSGNYPKEVQKAALFAVGNHDTEEVKAFLTEVALSHSDIELSKAAVFALSNSGGEAAVVALIRVLSSDSPSEVRKAAVHALGNIDSSTARKALVDLIKNQ